MIRLTLMDIMLIELRLVAIACSPADEPQKSLWENL
jgi:hypothetical protein